MATGIFPGKFAPFHKGHSLVVQGMIKTCTDVVIILCGAEKLDERREAISAALLDIDIMDATLVSVPDCKTDDEWADRVLEAAGNSSGAVVWSGRDAVRAIFEKRGVATKKIVHVPGFGA